MAAVPNSSNFSFADVCLVLYGSSSTSGRNLNQCFTDSVDSKFDTNYKGSKNSLMNFRNYNYAKPICTISAVQTSSNLIHASSSVVVASSIYVVLIYLDTSNIQQNYGVTIPAGANTSNTVTTPTTAHNVSVLNITPTSDSTYTYSV